MGCAFVIAPLFAISGVVGEYTSLSPYSLCQTVLIVSTSNEKYRLGVPFKVLTKQVGL